MPVVTGKVSICLLACAVIPGIAPVVSGGEGRAEGHILVQFNTTEVKKRFGAEKLPTQLLDKALGMPAGSRLEESAFAKWRRTKLPQGKRDDGTVDTADFFYLHLPQGMTPEECVERLKDSPVVEVAEPDYTATVGATYPADPNWSAQWHLRDVLSGRISAPEGWDFTTGSTVITVAVIDTGCDTNILEFQGRHVPGYNFVRTNYDVTDVDGHGTAVAATLCASANNGTNGVGVDWQCKLMPLKVFEGVTNQYSWIAGAIDLAVSNGAKVINLSAGGTNDSVLLSNAVCRAVSNGAIFVTITHNDGRSWVRYPGAYPESITVGAVDEWGVRCSFSNYGTNITMVAPGTNIYTTGRGNAWEVWWGTSFAAPQVAGAASLLCALRPDLRQEQVKALLCAGARDQVGSDTNDLSGYDLHYGWGILNLSNTLMLAQSEVKGFVQTNGNQLALTWPCPSNAWTNKPFAVSYTESLVSNSWTSASNVTYAGATASWVETNTTQGARFYRVVIPKR